MKKTIWKWTSKLSYVAEKIFDNDLEAIHKIKTTLTLNKPAYVVICRLELCKVPMYEFHYDYIKSKHGNKLRLLFIDTEFIIWNWNWKFVLGF